MNPLGLDTTALLLWAWAAHWIVDLLLQNEWMALNKMNRRARFGSHRDARVLDDEEVAAQTGALVVTAYGNTYGPLPTRWWDRHPAAYVHAGLHAVPLVLVFGWPGLVVALAHLVIDCRTVLAWWSRRIGQTQPTGFRALTSDALDPNAPYLMDFDFDSQVVRVVPQARDATEALSQRLDTLELRLKGHAMPMWSIGAEVRFWNDQAAHVLTLVAAALVVGAFT